LKVIRHGNETRQDLGFSFHFTRKQYYFTERVCYFTVMSLLVSTDIKGSTGKWRIMHLKT